MFLYLSKYNIDKVHACFLRISVTAVYVYTCASIAYMIRLRSIIPTYWIKIGRTRAWKLSLKVKIGTL